MTLRLVEFASQFGRELKSKKKYFCYAHLTSIPGCVRHDQVWSILHRKGRLLHPEPKQSRVKSCQSLLRHLCRSNIFISDTQTHTHTLQSKILHIFYKIVVKDLLLLFVQAYILCHCRLICPYVRTSVIAVGSLSPFSSPEGLVSYDFGNCRKCLERDCEPNRFSKGRFIFLFRDFFCFFFFILLPTRYMLCWYTNFENTTQLYGYIQIHKSRMFLIT